MQTQMNPERANFPLMLTFRFTPITHRGLSSAQLPSEHQQKQTSQRAFAPHRTGFWGCPSQQEGGSPDGTLTVHTGLRWSAEAILEQAAWGGEIEKKLVSAVESSPSGA